MIQSLILMVLTSVFFIPGTFAEDAPIGSYANYQENVTNYCQLKKEGMPNRGDLWNGWKSDSLIKIDEVRYADITKKTGDATYKQYLKNIKADPSRIDTIDLLAGGPGYLEKAQYVYAETMGTIYKCAVLNAKIKITNGLLETAFTKQSNIRKSLEDQIKIIRKEIDGNYCRDISKPSQDTSTQKELSVKKILLDNTMYQYCNYRYYLYYLDYNARNSTNTFFRDKQNGSGALFKGTDSAAGYIQKQNNRITTEIAHVKEIYPQALVAYTEFERTYASHIALLFILQDYIALRNTLNKLMNPIGQVIYKISNAQSPGR